jgi:hypothetical protein
VQYVAGPSHPRARWSRSSINLLSQESPAPNTVGGALSYSAAPWSQSPGALRPPHFEYSHKTVGAYGFQSQTASTRPTSIGPWMGDSRRSDLVPVPVIGAARVARRAGHPGNICRAELPAKGGTRHVRRVLLALSVSSRPHDRSRASLWSPGAGPLPLWPRATAGTRPVNRSCSPSRRAWVGRLARRNSRPRPSSLGVGPLFVLPSREARNSRRHPELVWPAGAPFSAP